MRLDPFPRFPESVGQLAEKLTLLFRDAAQQVNAAADGQIVASNNARTSIPTTGTFAKGDFVRKDAPSVSGSGIVVGWLRITDGSSHTLDTDWVACTIPVVSLSSGTYSPTLTAVSNIGSLSAEGFCWTRLGNVVSVAGHVTATPTSASTSTTFGISLPVASAFTAIADLAGTGKQITATNGESLGVYADATNDRAEAGFFSSNNSNSRYVVHFQYTIK